MSARPFDARRSPLLWLFCFNRFRGSRCAVLIVSPVSFAYAFARCTMRIMVFAPRPPHVSRLPRATLSLACGPPCRNTRFGFTCQSYSPSTSRVNATRFRHFGSAVVRRHLLSCPPLSNVLVHRCHRGPSVSA